MHEKICIDTRIFLLIVFAIPIIGVLFISLKLNTAQVSQNSKANEEKNLNVVSTTSIPSGVRAFCMVSSKNTLNKTIDLYLVPHEDVLPQAIKVFVYSAPQSHYVGLITYPFPNNIEKPLYTLKNEVLSGMVWVKFIGLQNADESQIADFADSCPVPVQIGR